MVCNIGSSEEEDENLHIQFLLDLFSQIMLVQDD